MTPAVQAFGAAMLLNGIPFSSDGVNININGVGLTAAQRESIANNTTAGTKVAETDNINVSAAA